MLYSLSPNMDGHSIIDPAGEFPLLLIAMSELLADAAFNDFAEWEGI